MRFQVPQFIEVEDKIFGPFTVKQFVYLAGGGAICFMLYRFLNFYIALFFIIPIGSFSVALAMYKVNGRPFILMVESALKFFVTNKLYIWKKSEKIPEHKEEVVAPVSIYVPKLSDSKLKDLTWSLDINENMSLGAKETMKK